MPWRSLGRRAALVRIAVTILTVAGGVSMLTAAHKMHWKAFGSALGQVSGPLLAAALAVSTIQVVSQLARFLVLIPRDQSPPLWELLDATAVGQLLNYVTPLRSGDAYKLVRLFPGREAAEGRLRALVTALVLERVADVIALVVMTGFAAHGDVRAWLLSGVVTQASPRVLGLLLVCGVAFVALLVRLAPRFAAIGRFLDGASLMLRSPRFALGIIVAMITWFFDAGTLWCTAQSVGHFLSLRNAMECVFLLNLGIALPVTVGNVGVFEASLAFGLSRLGIPAEDSLVIATLEHIVKFGGLVLCVGMLRLRSILVRVRA